MGSFRLTDIGTLSQLSFPTRNLVAYYRFDETSGTAVSDRTGNHNATASNAAIWNASGKKGYCISPKRTYRVTVDNSNDFNPETGAYSWSAWIYGQSYAHRSNTLFGKTNGGGASSSYGYQIFHYTSGSGYIAIAFATSDSAHFIRGFVYTELPAGQWNHLVCTLAATRSANTDFKMYVNGVEKTLTQVAGSITNHTGSITNSVNFVISGESDLGFEWSTPIDEVAIWKGRELTQSEVTSIYNSGNGIYY